MPKFKYSKREAEYRYANGRPVAAQTMNAWARTAIENAEAAIAQDAAALGSRKLTLAQFRDKMREHIRAGHRNMAKMAYGPNLSPRELGRLGAIVKAQYKFLDNFLAQIRSRKIKRDAAAVPLRAKLYVRALWATYQNELKRAKKDAGFTHAANVLDDEAESCQECPDLTDRGYIPIDDMPNIGQRACSIGCRCSLEFSRVAS